MSRVRAFAKALLLASVGAAVPLAPCLSQPTATLPTEEGYAIDPPGETVQNAPRGSVGRKTTDRQHRVGNTEETDGNERTIVLTVGGFVKECARAVGLADGDFAVVEGEFVYSLTWDDTNSDEGEVRREHIEQRMDARLEGHVLDDGEIDVVRLSGTVTIVHNGSHVQPRGNTLPVDAEFKIDSNGFPAGLRAVGDASWAKPPDAGEHEVAATLIAGAAFISSTNYKLAHTAWMTKNKCVEAKFTPESESVSLSPGESKDVRTQVVTKEGQTPVKATFRRADELPRSGVGTVAPERFEGEPQTEVTFRYTAPSRPVRGSGFVVGAVSRAGAAEGNWLISDRARYEGTFTQVVTAEGAVAGLSANIAETVTGRLVWMPDPGGTPRSPTFGDARSQFYVPTDGEITVEFTSDNRGVGGSNCRSSGRQTFALTGMPLQYLLLEIADDGRYNLTLAIPDYPQQSWEVESVCTFPGTRATRQKTPATRPAVMLAVPSFQGTLNADRAVVGELAAPVRRGPQSMTGNWSFSRAEETP